MNLLLVLIAFAGIAAIDVPGMVKSKRWHDLTVYSILFLLVLVLGILVALDVKVPSPIKAIQAFYRDILHLSFKIS
ncbi:conserved protein of unknown function [Ruminococcaceae bacterium BL-6]|jgi:uncharacterized membrane protein YhaH (DUF805 family)|nr:conserved protein of unknown function [Ruminococcaceae bacterium BL-6]HBC25921.1 hypothetical protein [Oscillospiraceae bacterium]